MAKCRAGTTSYKNEDLFVDAPLLISEDDGHYDFLRKQVAKVTKPKTIFEWMLIEDYVYYAWQALRLRRMLRDLVQAAQKSALELLISKHDLWPLAYEQDKKSGNSSTAALNYYVRREIKEKFDLMFCKFDIDTDLTIAAEAYINRLHDIERIEKKIFFFEERRDMALQQLSLFRNNQSFQALCPPRTISRRKTQASLASEPAGASPDEARG